MGRGLSASGLGTEQPGSALVLAITRDGIALAGRLVPLLPNAQLLAPERLRDLAEAAAPGACKCYSGPLRARMAALFTEFDAIVAVCSIGALVRLIAPQLRDKHQDPAVVALDQAGRFVIPILSGHLGGANALADRLARGLAATPVLTTASDVRQTLAVDLLGRELGWRIHASPADLLRASAAMVNDEPVALMQEAGSPDWWRGHANGRTGPLPANLHCLCASDLAGLDGAGLEAAGPNSAGWDALGLGAYRALLWISHRSPPAAISAGFSGALIHYRPPASAAGREQA